MHLEAVDNKEVHLREQVRRSAIFIAMMLVLIAFYFVFFMGEPLVAGSALGCALMILSVVVRGATSRPSGISSFRPIILGAIAVFSSSFFNNGLLGTSAFWLICIPLVAMEFLPRRAAAIALALHLGVLLTLAGVQMVYPAAMHAYDDGRQWSLALLDHFGLFITASTLSYVAAKSRRQLAEEVSVKNLLLSRLLQLLGHDMANAIGVIAMSQRRLLERFEQLPPDIRDQQAERLLNMMGRQISNLQSLIEKSRQLAKWQSGRRLETEAFLINDAIDDAWALCKEAAHRKGILFKRDESQSDLWVDADRVILVHEGLQNYFSNAVKFSPQGGTIWLRVVQESGHVIVEIEDEGAGIPLDVLQGLEGGGNVQSSIGTAGELGTGFGLSLARDLLHATGVHVHLNNKAHSERLGLERPRQGTVVRMTIPPASKKSVPLKTAA